MTMEAIRADISDQAFIRHQNHLSMSTSPMPADIGIRNSHAAVIESICNATIPAININTTEAILDTST